MPVPSLPLEIFGTILKHTSDRGDKARCCLVSKCLLPIARAELYRTVTLDFEERSGWDEAIEGEEPPLNAPSSPLLPTLAANPSLGALVRTLSILGAFTEIEAFESVATALLVTCTHLTSLRLHLPDGTGEMPARISEALSRLAPQLESLAMHGSCWSGGHGALLVQLTSLKSLSLGLHELPTLPHPPTFHLNALVAWSLFGTPLSHDIVWSSRNTLANLKFSTLCLDAAFEFGAFIALRRVDVLCNLNIDEQGELEALFKSIGLAPSLRELALSHVFADGPESNLEGFQLLHLLPPSLTHFSLFDAQIDSKYLVNALQDSHCLPALESLRLDYLGEPWIVWFETEELEAVKQAASSRGIELDLGGLSMGSDRESESSSSESDEDGAEEMGFDEAESLGQE